MEEEEEDLNFLDTKDASLFEDVDKVKPERVDLPFMTQEEEKRDILLKSRSIAEIDRAKNLEHFREIATLVIQSKLAPRGVDTVEKVLVILQTGKELGITPMVALSNIHVIEGRPALGVHLITTLLKRAGVEWKTVEDYVQITKVFEENGKQVEKPVDFRTTIVFYRKGTITDVIEEKVSFTYKDAVAAGLSTKVNWKSYPKLMTWNRCLVIGARRIAPDAILGMYEQSEVADMYDIPYQVEE